MEGEVGAKPIGMVFTLGTSTRSLREFVDILKARGIARVCDVRSFPSSKRHPQFSRGPFAAALEEAGVEYFWLGERLGGYRKGGYRAHMETAEFEAGLGELQRLAAQAPTAVVCAEALPWRCHRRFIAAALKERGWKVTHVIDASRDWDPGAREENASLFDARDLEQGR